MFKKFIKHIPPKVRITSKVFYEVLFVDKFYDSDKTLGESRPDTKQIIINKNQTDTEIIKVLIHEVLHSISFENPGLNLTERQVLILEEAIFRVLKLNGVFKLFTKLIK